jgi:hypothetical protein
LILNNIAVLHNWDLNTMNSSQTNEKIQKILYGNLDAWKHQIQAFTTGSASAKTLKTFVIEELKRFEEDLEDYLDFRIDQNEFAMKTHVVKSKVDLLAFIKAETEHLKGQKPSTLEPNLLISAAEKEIYPMR